MATSPRRALCSALQANANSTLKGGYSGYAKEALPDGTGAWLAHRDDVDVPGSGPGGGVSELSDNSMTDL